MSRTATVRVAPAALLALGLLTGGCGGSSSPTAGSSAVGSPSAASPAGGSLTVFAAASLTGAFTDLGKKFEQVHRGTKVTLSFGASSTLAQQIVAGAPADVFASASPKNMTQLTDAGDAGDPKTFATNVAEVAVSPDSKGRIASLGDLAKPGVKVALCQPQVPCGALAQKVLANAKVTVHPVTQGLDVKSTLAYVTGGEADAAIVYATDVQAAGDAVVGVEVPAAQNASTAYPIATVKGSKNAALAASFEDFVLSAAGQAVLTEAGFQAP